MIPTEARIAAVQPNHLQGSSQCRFGPREKKEADLNIRSPLNPLFSALDGLGVKTFSADGWEWVLHGCFPVGQSQGLVAQRYCSLFLERDSTLPANINTKF